ncbi:TetR/AcrR family transcriptional regulator [Actinoplanes sp. NPDC049596]|uniref:TetR/AcrR family transcriptional regulator n=1 Tax=unclassified Actinoplanes TaxID=2626549 RepID=UPI00343298B1
MPRPTKQQIDDEILEAAATLFARHGFRETSVQRIADAVGYSKTGLLHRYPTKEALQQAVVDKALSAVREIVEQVEDMPPGPARDRAVLSEIAQLAMDLPGTVALLLSALQAEPESDLGHALEELGQGIFAAFALDPECDNARGIRVIGALGALVLLGITMRDKPLVVTHDDLVAVSYDALGHK